MSQKMKDMMPFIFVEIRNTKITSWTYLSPTRYYLTGSVMK